MKTRILGKSKDNKTAKVRFEFDDGTNHVRSINCGFENGEYSKSKTDEIIAATARMIEDKRSKGLL